MAWLRAAWGEPNTFICVKCHVLKGRNESGTFFLMYASVWHSGNKTKQGEMFFLFKNSSSSISEG